MEYLFDYWWVLVILIVLFAGLKTINQGTIGVVTVFGKYQRVLKPGLRLIIPFIEQIYKKISIQNR
ncbi:MAG: SPFH domain-containing protein, partial [Flavitalea sp.]